MPRRSDDSIWCRYTLQTLFTRKIMSISMFDPSLPHHRRHWQVILRPNTSISAILVKSGLTNCNLRLAPTPNASIRECGSSPPDDARVRPPNTETAASCRATRRVHVQHCGLPCLLSGISMMMDDDLSSVIILIHHSNLCGLLRSRFGRQGVPFPDQG